MQSFAYYSEHNSNNKCRNRSTVVVLFCCVAILLMHLFAFADMMLDVQRLLQQVGKLGVLNFHGGLDDCELQAIIQYLSQGWLVLAQPFTI